MTTATEPIEPAAPTLEYFGTLRIEVAEPVEVGRTHAGQRRVIPITGGTLTGPNVSGTILDAGADFQVIRSATESDLDARYVIELDDGARIFVTNMAYRTGAAEDITALAEGKEVPAERIYFRCAPRFEVADTEQTSWRWLESTVVVGSGRREPAAVIIDLWIVR
ncbi:DUF3237 domain-containing protein [Yaniella flava]|uniref:UPF0311 protein GCM10009720_04900 n=1 Tax=Yaniella flava TaxID=287930 RepID=A0ABN2U4N0_9MICC